MAENTHYNFREIEKKIYQHWESNNFFNPDKITQNRSKTFSVVLPPPNITGTLHVGHALNTVIQDILVRYHRMLGEKTVWIPGTDHASIALQNVVEKKLKKEGINRFDLGREKFIEKCWEWRNEYGNIILNQLKTLGASCDWTRTKFTMDNDYINAVEYAFIHYQQKGLIYRGERVVNWCPRCATSLSDLELEYANEPSKLWYLKYQLSDKSGKSIIVATTRPETLLGDTAVAVNHKDKRYQDFIGKEVLVPIVNRRIPIVGDDLVDPSFGAGAVKVTPAHDLNDWTIAQRHHLPLIAVINDYGRLNQNAPAVYQNLKTDEARKKIISDLDAAGLLQKTEDYIHRVPKCYRCGGVVELIPSQQWFLKMDDLSKMASSAVESQKVKFYPQRWKKVFIDWQKASRDWCISRQLWWGQRLPVWFCQNESEKYIVASQAPQECPICRRCQMKRSEDVLDTWFSSALWPLAVFGWPNKNQDFDEFYPTNVLSTARDILHLWVARMIFSGIEFTKKAPFSDVIIHATILTKEGKRMSKSLGTGIDPMVLVEKYGTDAVRFGLAWQIIVDSQDIHFAEDTMISGKKFCNKIFNAARFVKIQVNDAGDFDINIKPNPQTTADQMILQKFGDVLAQTNNFIAVYELGQAIRGLYEFFWHDFCDIYIENAKRQITDSKIADNTKIILIYVLANSLKLLHPFMPFITTEIYSGLPLKNKEELMLSSWPRC